METVFLCNYSYAGGRLVARYRNEKHIRAAFRGYDSLSIVEVPGGWLVEYKITD